MEKYQKANRTRTTTRETTTNAMGIANQARAFK